MVATVSETTATRGNSFIWLGLRAWRYNLSRRDSSSLFLIGLDKFLLVEISEIYVLALQVLHLGVQIHNNHFNITSLMVFILIWDIT